MQGCKGPPASASHHNFKELMSNSSDSIWGVLFSPTVYSPTPEHKWHLDEQELLPTLAAQWEHEEQLGPGLLPWLQDSFSAWNWETVVSAGVPSPGSNCLQGARRVKLPNESSDKQLLAERDMGGSSDQHWPRANTTPSSEGHMIIDLCSSHWSGSNYSSLPPLSPCPQHTHNYIKIS